MGTYAFTGGASGIGAALIAAMADEGHSIINIDIKDADIVADLSNSEERSAAIAEVLNLAPDGLDGFVPLAGVSGGAIPGKVVTSLNYYGTVKLVEGLRSSLEKKQGSVVLLSSNSAPMQVGGEELINSLLAGDEIASQTLAESITQGTHYMLTKRALIFWMQRNVMAYGRKGVRINAVAPGPVLTPMTKPLFESDEYAPVMQRLLDLTPINRAGQPEEVAKCIKFLLSSSASYVSGSLLYIDGGYNGNTRQDHY